jgi:uncharacterized protein YjbI with pentapeptide repeats
MSESDDTNAIKSGWSPSEEELEGILREHKEWLESEGEERKRADLSTKSLISAHLPGVDLRRADLSEVDLREADLSQADLREANLSKADLGGADLSEADLRGADFSEGNLRTAMLTGANLQEANFSKVDFREADLSGASLSDTNLSKANLSDTDLSGTDLWGADLSGTELQNKDLSDARLQVANLSESNLSNTNLSGAGLQKADLSGANLFGAILSEASLQEANLSGANLRSSKLVEAKLLGADLSEADLQRADLSNADITDANLRESNLRNAGGIQDTNGLQAQGIARANVSNATLPEDLAEFDGLKVVEEASRGARKLFIALGLACAYSALTLSAAPSEEFVPLPFVDVEMSLWSFYLVVPMLLAFGFGYFQLQMQRVWEEMSRLPAIFPDGKATDQKIHPWLVTGLARAHFPYLREDTVPLFPLQKFVVVGLAWGTVPVTQGYFVANFVARYPEYAYQSGIGAALVVLTVVGAVVSYQTTRNHLRGEYEGPFRPFGDEEDVSIRKRPNWHTVFLSTEWSLLIFALWIGWTFVL